MPATISPSTLQTAVSCNGVSEQIVTTQEQGEPLSAFQERHLAAIEAAEEDCNTSPQPGQFTFGITSYTTPVDCNGISATVRTEIDGIAPSDAFFMAHGNDVRKAINDCA